MTNNTTDSSFALVPEEAARQEIENLRKENSELKAMVEAYKQLPATLEAKLREKESELARSEADYKKAVQEKNEISDSLTKASTLSRSLFTRLASWMLELDDEETRTLNDLVFRLRFPDDVIGICNEMALRELSDGLEPVVADSEEKCGILCALLRALDAAFITSAYTPF